MRTRFAARLRRLARLAALLPPPDPFRDHPPEDLERACAIVAARTPHLERDLHVWAMRGEEPPAKPEVSREDAAWFLRVIAPVLPAHARFLEKHRRWQGQFRRRPRTAEEKLACIFPAFAGARFRVPAFGAALPDDLLPGLARLAGEGYEPATSS
jgi:hypothetical protein